MPRLVFFDCDSTLSAIEGIDEMARFRSEAVLKQVEAMTRSAMEGGVPLEEVFARRLEMIRPTRQEMEKIGSLYIEHVEPDAIDVIEALKKAGWTPMIVSGGFRQAILPLANYLGIARVEAVDVFFHADGSYKDFGHDCPTARAYGKNTVIASLKQEFQPTDTVMVGDGMSDLETAPDVRLFVGFGRYAIRERVKTQAGAFIMQLGELPGVLGI